MTSLDASAVGAADRVRAPTADSAVPNQTPPRRRAGESQSLPGSPSRGHDSDFPIVADTLNCYLEMHRAAHRTTSVRVRPRAIDTSPPRPIIKPQSPERTAAADPDAPAKKVGFSPNKERRFFKDLPNGTVRHHLDESPPSSESAEGPDRTEPLLSPASNNSVFSPFSYQRLSSSDRASDGSPGSSASDSSDDDELMHSFVSALSASPLPVIPAPICLVAQGDDGSRDEEAGEAPLPELPRSPSPFGKGAQRELKARAAAGEAVEAGEVTDDGR